MRKNIFDFGKTRQAYIYSSYALILALFVVMFACENSKDDTPAAKPTADFLFTPATPSTQDEVSFTAVVQNAKSFNWVSAPSGFTSTQQNPKFTFTTAGTYVITFTAIGDGGNTSVNKSITISEPKPIVDFTFTPTAPTVGEVVTFTASVQNVATFEWSSSPIGLTSNLQNPSFAFQTAGTYQITLKATGTGGSSSITKSITVTIPNAKPTADFAFSPAEPEEGQEVTFENKSVNADTYAWDFGGGRTSTEKNPKLIFNNAADYAVKLTAKGAGGEESITKTVRIKTKTNGGTACGQINRCNAPLCYISKLTSTITGGTVVTNFEYRTVAGIKVVAKITSNISTNGLTIGTTSTFDYDSQARNITVTTITQSVFGTTTTSITTSTYNGCVKMRDDITANGIPAGYTLYAYDGAGRLIKTTVYNVSGVQTSYSTFENFNVLDLSQIQKSYDGTGILTANTTLTYQNCQPIKLIGRDAAGNIILDQTNELNVRGFIGKSTSISTVIQAGVSTTETTIINYEYQCD